MPKVAILYIALGRYTVFWKEFFESCEDMLMNCEKHYFIWTDNPESELIYADRANVTVIPTQKKGWPFDSLLRFQMFTDKKKELSRFDYVFFFNANFKFYNPTDLSEIAPREWNDGLVAGIHPSILTHDISNPDFLPYERRPESTAGVPFGQGKYYVCGAFNGGTSAAFLEMCQTLMTNVQTDLNQDIIALVDDESHLNAYMVNKNLLVSSVAYGFPESHLKRLRPRQRTMVKIISRTKDHPKYGGIRYLRGATDKRMSNTFMTPILKTLFRIISGFVPNKTKRKKIRSYFG